MPLLAWDGIYITEDIGYMSSNDRQKMRKEFQRQIPKHMRVDIVEFTNPRFGPHIAAIMVIRPWI
jgi:hypothetical protein